MFALADTMAVMDAPWNVVAALGAAFVALVGVIAGTNLSDRARRSHWSREAQLKACAELLDGYTEVVLGLGHACRHRQPSQVDWVAWERVLAGLSLVAPPQVVEAARRLDEQIWRSHLEMRMGDLGQDAWLRLREPIEKSRKDFVNVARRQVVPDNGGDLIEVRGRPADDDPIWARVRKAHPEGYAGADS